MPQESNQVVRLVEGIWANFRPAIARPEPRTFGADIESFYRYSFPAQAAGCGQTRLVHSQYKGSDSGIECFSTSSRMHEHRTSHSVDGPAAPRRSPYESRATYIDRLYLISDCTPRRGAWSAWPPRSRARVCRARAEVWR